MTPAGSVQQPTWDRLLGAARAVFEESGYAAATVEEICEKAGFSRVTFYKHFDGKLGAIRALGNQLLPESLVYYRELDNILAQPTTADFEAWMRRAVGWFEEHAPFLRAWDECVVLERGLVPDLYVGLVDEMVTYLGAASGPQAEASRRLRVELLIMQLERFFIRWKVHGAMEIDRETAIQVLTDLWMTALLDH